VARTAAADDLTSDLMRYQSKPISSTGSIAPGVFAGARRSLDHRNTIGSGCSQCRDIETSGRSPSGSQAHRTPSILRFDAGHHRHGEVDTRSAASGPPLA
jgi:hypothetical protein